MNRKEELEFMLKGAEVNLVYACKAVCEKGVNLETNVNLDYARQSYNFIHNSLSVYDEPDNMKAVESNEEDENGDE